MDKVLLVKIKEFTSFSYLFSKMKEITAHERRVPMNTFSTRCFNCNGVVMALDVRSQRDKEEAVMCVSLWITFVEIVLERKNQSTAAPDSTSMVIENVTPPAPYEIPVTLQFSCGNSSGMINLKAMLDTGSAISLILSCYLLSYSYLPLSDDFTSSFYGISGCKLNIQVT